MAGNLVSVSNGIASGTQPVARSGSERQVPKEVGELGKALQGNDVAAAQSAVAALKANAPNENRQTDFQNAVKALDQALKANNAKAATEAFAALQQSQQKRAQGQARPAQQPAAPAHAAPEPARQTRELQKAAQAAQAHEAATAAFLTRQDLAAKASATPKPASLGKNIDTTA